MYTLRVILYTLCVLGLRSSELLMNLNYLSKKSSKYSIRLYCDNKAAITLLIIQSNMIEPSTLRLTSTLLRRNCVQALSVHHMWRQENNTDILTKAIWSNVFHTILNKLGMQDIFASAWWECWCATFICYLLLYWMAFMYLYYLTLI